ncbi:hypothetical protein DFH06DRAFT_1478068 [Mycena polygramma]|nr:hypothetical protein DFH06DRAFT_1216461 [Mycena polygramma]KAJ7640059.1 hypothetical protein DFH06DRAFT_1216481 [Mycena polygramma]KAJ7640061.1 hypothetical protein DFH06DRAFT_1478068 [Mycena polygramma]
MQFSLITLLAVVATGVVGAPASSNSPDNSTSTDTSTAGPAPPAVNFGNIGTGIADGATVCGPCVSSLKGAGSACATAAGETGKNVIDDLKCLAAIGSGVMSLPPSCSNCTAWAKTMNPFHGLF